MPNLANAVIVGVILFFALLAAFWYTVEVRSQDKVGVETVDLRWADGEPGKAIEVDVSLHNPRRTEAEVEAMDVTVRTGDQQVAKVSRPLEAIIAAGDREPVTFTIALPDDFATVWWAEYTTSGEHGDLVLEGELTVVQSVRRTKVPFTSETSWDGRLAQRLAAAGETCPPDADVCLTDTEASWDETALRLRLLLGNERQEDVEVTNVTVGLLFGSRRVAEGGGEGSLNLSEGQARPVNVELGFSSAMLKEWWPTHVAECERTPTALTFEVSVEWIEPGSDDAPPEHHEATLEWTIQAPDFRTEFACGGEA